MFSRKLERALIEPSLAALKGRLAAPSTGSVARYRKTIRNIGGSQATDTLDFSGVTYLLAEAKRLRGNLLGTQGLA